MNPTPRGEMKREGLGSQVAAWTVWGKTDTAGPLPNTVHFGLSLFFSAEIDDS